MIGSCLTIKQKVVELSYGMHMTPIFKAAQVSLEGEESKYIFMRFTTKTLGQLHITSSNMPTPPSSGTSGSVKRYADQKVQKTWKKRRVEKVINLSSIQKKEGDGSSENMEDDEAHSPPALKLFQQVAKLARKAVQNVVGENKKKKQLQKEVEIVEEEIVQDEVVTQMEDYEIPQRKLYGRFNH